MNPLLGIGLQLGATLAFTIMAALVRFLGDRVPIGEIVFSRSFFALIPLLLVLAWRGELMAVRTKNLFGHLGRSITGIIAMFSNFAALARLPLADATAIGFAAPLMNVALAALMLGEVVRLWRWSAVAVGFFGVLVMLSPHLGEGMQDPESLLGAMLAVAGAFFVALAMTQVRYLAATETTASLVFSFSLISTLAGLATLPSGWVMPAPIDTAALVASGIIGGIAQILLTESYRHSAASVVAPFAYTAMLWSMLLGFIMFGELPEWIVLVGAAVVVAAGILFVIWRERQLGIDRTLEREAETPPAGPPV